LVRGLSTEGCVCTRGAADRRGRCIFCAEALTTSAMLRSGPSELCSPLRVRWFRVSTHVYTHIQRFEFRDSQPSAPATCSMRYRNFTRASRFSAALVVTLELRVPLLARPAVIVFRFLPCSQFPQSSCVLEEEAARQDSRDGHCWASQQWHPNQTRILSRP
jgi:hypothetical protein